MCFLFRPQKREPKKGEEEKEGKRMRTCELCESVARMYCESDQANLCWRCDEKVHRANFLVAKHSRSLLCHVCQSLTAWKASGPKLSPTVSVCDSCVTSAHGEAHDNELVKPENKQSERTTDEDDDGEYDDDYDDDDDDDDDEYDDLDVDYDEEDDENQVVPWSGDSEYPPTLVASSSCCSSSVEQGSLKRGLDFSDFYSDVRLVPISLYFVLFCLNACSVSLDLAECDFENRNLFLLFRF